MKLHRGLFVFVALISCASKSDDVPRIIQPEKFEQQPEQPPGDGHYVTPTRLALAHERPIFKDDLQFKLMLTALDRQISRFNEIDLSGTIRFGTKTYPAKQLKLSLLEFRKQIVLYENCLSSEDSDRNCEDQLNRQIIDHFEVYVPDVDAGETKDPQKPASFTAYYTPTILAQRKLSETYKYPIYARPDGPLQSLAEKFDRREIDFKGKLKGQGLELYYAKDRFDIYNLHIEGGGRVLIKDEKNDTQYLSYDGTNKKSWRFISKYMAQKGYIKDLSMKSQAKFLKTNLKKHEEIYSTCPSYVYFKKTDHEPEGSDRVPLTDNRSIATDRNFYSFKGTLAYIEAERPTADADEAAPVLKVQKFSRFVLDQDTGGAIRGKARVDIYFGQDEYAKLAAHTTKNNGRIYFLVLKEIVP